jgi:inner membrane protein
VDSLTQIALGAAVGHVVLGRRLGRRALVYGAVLGTVPDLDILVPMGGPIEDFTYHRGASHSWIMQLLLAPLLGWLFARWHPRRSRVSRGSSAGRGLGSGASSGTISTAAWIGFVLAIWWTHALLDAFTVYGTQLFWPWFPPPASIASIFIIDPLYTLPLLFCSAIAWRAGRGLSRRAWRANLVGVVLSSLYLLWSLGAQQLVLAGARDSLQERGLSAERILATPAPFNTLLWRLVVIDGDGRYLEGFDSLVDGAPVQWHERPRNAQLLASLEGEWSLRQLDWFTHGFWAVQREGDELVIEDLRMGLAPDYVFRFCIARVDEAGQVVPVEAERRRRAFRVTRLEWVWDRIWAPLPVLP